jgi:hypothetical protein
VRGQAARGACPLSRKDALGILPVRHACYGSVLAQCWLSAGSVLGPQVLADGVGAVTGLFHGLLQLFLGHAQRLGPVLDFVLLVQVDTGAVLLASVLQIVGHDGLLYSCVPVQHATGRGRIPFAGSRKAFSFIRKKVPMRQQYSLSMISKPSNTPVE